MVHSCAGGVLPTTTSFNLEKGPLNKRVPVELRLSIDRARFTREFDAWGMHHFLRSLIGCPSRISGPNPKKVDGRFGWMTELEVEGRRYKVWHAEGAGNKFCRDTQISVQMYQPNAAILSLLMDHGWKGWPRTKWRISEVEFAFDFHSSQHAELLRFFKKHLFLKNRRSRFDHSYPTGYYLNNLRKTSGKGVRVYLKPEDNPTHVRMEVVLKRSYFRRNKINAIEWLLAIRPEAVFTGLQFNHIDLEYVQRRLDRMVRSEEWTRNKACEFFKNLETTLDRDGINEAYDLAKTCGGRRMIRSHPFNEQFFNLISDMAFSDSVKWIRSPFEDEWIPGSWNIPKI